MPSLPDAVRAAQMGFDTVWISNHGGRQLDTAPATVSVLPAIQEALQKEQRQTQIILDGGIRRGSHVLKALAMGADACSIGRGYLYPLAAGGEAGVSRALSRLRAEIERDMILMGCDRVAKLDRTKLRAAGMGLHGVRGYGVEQPKGSLPPRPRVVA